MSLTLAKPTAVGENLKRPECVLCTADGSLFVSDWQGGVCRISPDGTQTRFLASKPPCELRPNGIALQRDGSFLLANLGDAGGVWTLHRDGRVEPFLLEVASTPLPPTNFVLPDRVGRTWVTVSTRIEPRADAYRPTAKDGFIALFDKRGARIAADGLGYTNEVQVHPSGDWLYVNETFARRLSRFRIGTNGELGTRETVTEFGPGSFPDGMCFDEEGGLWIVSVVSNRVFRLSPNGRLSLLFEDADPEHVAWVEAAFQAGTMGRQHFDTMHGTRLRNVSSIAFGGPNRRICYLGCLLGENIESFAAPIAGVEPVHWHWFE